MKNLEITIEVAHVDEAKVAPTRIFFIETLVVSAAVFLGIVVLGLFVVALGALMLEQLADHLWQTYMVPIEHVVYELLHW